jgi:hypothetical protein
LIVISLIGKTFDMAFIKQTAQKRWVPLTWQEPDVGEVSIDIHIVVPTHAQLLDVQVAANADTLDDFSATKAQLLGLIKPWLLGWADYTAETGKAVAFNDTTIFDLMAPPPVMAGFFKALVDAANKVADARAKNSTPLAPGGPAPMAVTSGPKATRKAAAAKTSAAKASQRATRS